MMPERLEDSRINYVKEAFLWQYNIIALVAAAAFAAVAGSVLPLVVAGAIELFYLGIVPRTGAFRRLVHSWKRKQAQRDRERELWQLFKELPREMQSRYADVDRICREILSNYERLSTASRLFSRQLADRLTSLLQAYLRLLHSAFLHRRHLRQTDPAAIRREMSALERALETEPPRVQEVNRKRLEILARRLEKYEKVKENQTVLDAQCAAIEDVLKLIRDQSLTMRDPQVLTDHLDHVLAEVEHTEETVREMEAIFALAAPELGMSASPEAGGGSAARGRWRLGH